LNDTHEHTIRDTDDRQPSTLMEVMIIYKQDVGENFSAIEETEPWSPHPSPLEKHKELLSSSQHSTDGAV
jgi:hypothetical protein